MDSLKFFSINMTLELAKTKNVDALELFFDSICEVLDEESLVEVFRESANTIRKLHPELWEWFIEELERLVTAYEDAVADEEAYNSNSNSEEEDGIFYITKQDIAHLLLDQGLDPKEDFEESENLILLSQRAREFLQEHYDLGLISTLIADKP